MAVFTQEKDLHRLARLWNVQWTYEDVTGREREASPDALLRTLQVLGAEIQHHDDAADAVRSRRQSLWRQVLPPVVTAWEGHVPVILVRLPIKEISARFHWRLEFESGEPFEHSGRLADLLTWRQRQVHGTTYVVKRLPVHHQLPWGYHRLTLETPDRQTETLLLAAPRKAYGAWLEPQDRLWGVFMPLYSLHHRGRPGAGDFRDLKALMEWVGRQGGSLVATLPLLASLWELIDDPSPYAPASRLFWNEFYIDLGQVPELKQDPTVAANLSSDLVSGDGGRLQETVDYRRQMAAKRRVLERLAASFFQSDTPRRHALEELCRDHPELDAFARFRAVGEQQQRTWPQWPERLRNGVIRPGDYQQDTYRYHLYTQWQAQEQIQSLAQKAADSRLLWYLDFPLGVNRAGFDVWRWPEVFALEASGGAPPDSFFTKGQNWAFPPLHPERLRAQGYQYFILALRRHLRYARVLRMDHVMSLQRLYWVPDGMDARDGVYVRYPREELFAVLSLESHRHQASIIGENLGTVPPGLNLAMRRHRVGDMYVVQYELKPDPDQPMREVPDTAVASLNTHDMPPFAAYWTGLDIDDRRALGLLDDRGAEKELESRAELRRILVDLWRRHGVLGDETSQKTMNTEAALQACLAMLADSDAPILLVNLEDLWLETRPQNVPGTSTERPNWRRLARFSFEEFAQSPAVLDILHRINHARRKSKRPPADS